MDYQLVFQFKDDACLDFDKMVELEDDLQQLVEPLADVDGHDMGSGEINIFILTDDPVGTFERAKPLLANSSLLDKVAAAYRNLRSDDFIVIWPEDARDEFVIS